jgi:NAD(P)-dependent dehydrogenase (short-subunit alcohol dehydrogenase family)
VIYGAGGGIGAGIATTFAREGARLHLAGRSREPLERVAAAIAAAGGEAGERTVTSHDGPSFEHYRRELRPDDRLFRAFKLDVLKIVDDRVIEATTFGPDPFEGFGLPQTLEP